MSDIVPNKFPLIETTNRIAIVGEAPGGDEIREGEPFVGQSGKFLAALLSRAGASREQCLLANVCQHRPAGNEIAAFDWQGPEIQSGLAQLYHDLKKFNPNIIICLGGASIHAMRCPEVVPRKYPKDGRWTFKWPYSPVVWRGTLFQARDWKCLGTVHPAYVLVHDYDSAPLLGLDLKKAVAESNTRELILPKRQLVTNLQPDEIVTRLKEIRKARLPIAIDIEGGIGTLSCISIAITSDHAFIIPFFNKAFNRPFPLEQEVQVWRALAEMLEDPHVPKTLQNSLYDLFVLAYSYGIHVRGLADDTMLKHWEHYCELEKSLGVQLSIYTKEPYYKSDRKTNDDTTFYEYCCRDSAGTYEINNFLEPRLSGTRREHYRFNMECLDILLDMELRGICYDTAGAAQRRASVRSEMHEEQARVNGWVGAGLRWQDLWQTACERLKKKKAFLERGDYSGLAAVAYKDRQDDARKLARLVTLPNPSLAVLGEIDDLLGLSINIGSNKQMCDLLYGPMGFPTQRKRRKRGQVEEPPPTADYEALLKLCKYCTRIEDAPRLAILRSIIKVRSLATRERMLSIHADPDGRIRCGYNIVGSNTGRITCYESPTGSGYNLQTIPEYDRDLFLADPGYYFFQCDLRGADGWTVAAFSAMCGDRTMLDDYLYGLQPARILVLQLDGCRVDYSNRAELKVACRDVDKKGWKYQTMKRVQHGASYLEGGQTMSDSILTDSEGALFIEPRECERLRDQFFFKRYPGVRLWHRWAQQQINERPTLIAPSGSLRHFFGRKEDLLPKFVAHLPQHNTTYTTKRAMHKCWHDPKNQGTPRRIIPLHTVHDSFNGQFRVEDTEWALPRIREYFNNPMIIAGQCITIPFEGTYGPSWGQQDKGKI